MSKMKKTIPTLVGGAMLLANSSVFAIDEIISQEDENQEVNTESKDVQDETVENVEKDDTLEIVVEVEEDSVLNADKNEVTTENAVDDSVQDDTTVDNEVSDEEIVETKPSVTQEEVFNLLANIRSVSQQKVMLVKSEAVDVREASATDSSKIGTLKKGEYVDVYEQDEKSGWSKINFEGKMAYVNTSDLENIAKVYKESSEANVIVRSGAGDTYGEFGKLAKGERVLVYQQLENGWSKISYNNKIAFVQTSKLVETYSSKAIVSVDKVNVYKGASDTSDILGESKKNETLFIYGEEGEFYKVKFQDTFGYVKKADLKLVQNTEKPQTGDIMVFSYMGAIGVSTLGMVSVNRKKKEN